MPQTVPVYMVLRCLARLWRWPVTLLAGLALSLGMSLGTQAATTWTVCASGCDYASIKAAIAAPTTLDGDTLAIAAGTHTEAGITVDKSLTLQGERAATTIVQAAASQSAATDRVFTIPSGVTVTLQALTIRYGHTAGSGGGVSNAGTLLLTDSTIRGNKARIGGGLSNHGTLLLTDSTVSGNTARYYGGGVYNYRGTLTLTRSTVSSNTTRDAGGGLRTYGGPLTLTHSTVSGNSAATGGGLRTSDAKLTLTHSTVSGNSAATGGGLYSRFGRLIITSSIVASQSEGRDCYIDNGSVNSHGYNLDSDTSCWLRAATDQPGVDPLLGPLQDNSGPTFTHALLPDSPAIDAIPWGTNGCGTPHIGDQRWQARPQPAWGACDSGAYEVEVAGQPLSAWVTGVTLRTVICQNLTTGQEVTLSPPVPPQDCAAAGLALTSGDRVAVRLRGPVRPNATDVGGAVVGMTPSRGTCTNVTTGQ
jgi:hypothetical protein